MASDEIRKQSVLRAPVERVWQAITDAGKFGEWFGVQFDGPFEAGRRATGRITPTRVDREVARLQEPHAGKPFEWEVESLQPESRAVFRWHPFAIDPAVDYSAEPMTRIEFLLEPVDAGTRLTIVESGFEAIPASRRAQAHAANADGWAHQLKLIEKFVVVPF